MGDDILQERLQRFTTQKANMKVEIVCLAHERLVSKCCVNLCVVVYGAEQNKTMVEK